eukprot:gnl/Trimastix_PCT/2739.p2 GENE.gnl/Trimastix_PCT/2739~~gnl/Trimastix_PCT/2739.p2  ORF type:complete len:169 (-),score=36.79 gnl/Trimastix_PCT/2739:802-1272(-)
MHSRQPSLDQGELTNEELNELFNIVDADHGGTLDREELKGMMLKIKMAPSEAEVERFISEFQLNEDGEIEREEFISVFRKEGKSPFSAEEVQNSFKHFAKDDPQGHICITPHLIRELAKFNTLGLTEAEVASLVEMLGKRGSLVNYMEFVDMMVTG